MFAYGYACGTVSASEGLPGSSPGGVSQVFGLMLFIEAQAFTSVPSTDTWSSCRSGATSRCARPAAITLRDISVVSRQSLFFEETMGTPPHLRFQAHQPAGKEVTFQLPHQLSCHDGRTPLA